MANISVRCKDAEYDAIKAKADSYGMELSEYVRFVSLHAKIKVEVKKKNS
jgi:predicted DNA binding CopG/RHH family protein